MIAIGTLGGSGTRAIADVFIQAGIYMGDQLNIANDNLIFTRLFKNPNWYRSATEKEIQNRLTLFKNYMSKDAISPAEFIEICRSASSNKVFPSNKEFYFSLSRKMLNKRKDEQRWGWKEPNTQIYADIFMDFYSNLKYIHIIRHGLDMAFSKNKQQLKNWGWKFNIHLSGKENDTEMAVKQLDYWIRSNQFIREVCAKHPERCLIVYYKDFCTDPIKQIDRMPEFSGINPDMKTRANLYRIPQKSGTNHRYKERDISIFSDEQIEQVIALGCQIDS